MGTSAERNGPRQYLTGGDRRTPGRFAEAVALLLGDPSHFAGLFECLGSSDAVIRSRAGDVIEKVTRINPALIPPCKRQSWTISKSKSRLKSAGTWPKYCRICA